LKPPAGRHVVPVATPRRHPTRMNDTNDDIARPITGDELEQESSFFVIPAPHKLPEPFDALVLEERRERRSIHTHTHTHTHTWVEGAEREHAHKARRGLPVA